MEAACYALGKKSHNSMVREYDFNTAGVIFRVRIVRPFTLVLRQVYSSYSYV